MHILYNPIPEWKKKFEKNDENIQMLIVALLNSGIIDDV